MNSGPVISPSRILLQLSNLFEPQRIRFSRRVFVNRNLRLSKITHVGFDLDYTLAQYNVKLEYLAWDLVKEVLVQDWGFPREILAFKYDPTFAMRGLVIDMVNGNIFKVDKFLHVGRAYHGTRLMETQARKDLYRRYPIHLSSSDFNLVDTLFSIPETHLYALYVDLIDDRGGPRHPGEYTEAFRAIRAAMDRIHKDFSLKARILGDPGTFLTRDPDLPLTLEHFIASGKRMFLVTNSAWDYTNGLMSWLIDALPGQTRPWTDYFDVVMVSAGKPRFFTRKEPLVSSPDVPPEFRDKVFSGGSLSALEERIGASGDEILYVGDHIYGDILKSKKTSTWRTALIVPEADHELSCMEKAREDISKVDRLFRSRFRLEVELNYQQRILLSILGLSQGHGNGLERHAVSLEEAAIQGEATVSGIRKELERVEEELSEARERTRSFFNTRWGMLFKEGSEHSIFGAQMEDFACVYTSRVSNFLSYSPHHYFRGPRDLLPHEIDF